MNIDALFDYLTTTARGAGSTTAIMDAVSQEKGVMVVGTVSEKDAIRSCRPDVSVRYIADSAFRGDPPRPVLFDPSAVYCLLVEMKALQKDNAALRKELFARMGIRNN